MRSAGQRRKRAIRKDTTPTYLAGTDSNVQDRKTHVGDFNLDGPGRNCTKSDPHRDGPRIKGAI